MNIGERQIIFLFFCLIAAYCAGGFAAHWSFRVLPKKERLLLMTIEQLKTKLTAAETAIKATVTTAANSVKLTVLIETGEIKAQIGNIPAGATSAQLQEIGDGIDHLEETAKSEALRLQTAAETEIKTISDNIAGSVPPPPLP